MAYIRTCVQNLGAIRRPVRKTCHSSLIIYRPHIVICRDQLECPYRDLSCFARTYGKTTETCAQKEGISKRFARVRHGHFRNDYW